VACDTLARRATSELVGGRVGDSFPFSWLSLLAALLLRGAIVSLLS
jgi:hypothetical protein